MGSRLLEAPRAAAATGALFSFGSFEPLLGPIDFGGGWMPSWVITGGETD